MAETLIELVARISADASELKKALASAEGDVKALGKETERQSKSMAISFKDLGKAATVMGGTISAAMGLMIRSFTRTGSELNDLAIKTGFSVEALAGLKFAAEQNGASLGTVEMAIRRTASAMQGARDGSLETTRAFTRMGLSLQDLQGLKPDQQFLMIAGAIAEIPDPMTRAATAVDLFGRSGTDMLPMLSQGAEGLRRMMEEGQKLTGWTDANAKLADEFGDALTTLKTAMTGVFNTIGAALAPALKDLANMLTGIIKSIIDWMQANPALVKAITTATLVVGTLATALGAATLAVTVLGTTINLMFAGVLIAIGAVVTGIILLIDWFNRAGNAAKRLAEDQKAAIEKQKAADKEYFATKRSEAQKATDNAIAAIRKEYGAAKDLTKSLIDQAYDVRDARLRAIDDAERAAENAHRKALDRAELEYRASLSREERQLQDQIDAIDNLTRTEDLALTRRDEQRRLAELQNRIFTAQTAEEASAAKIAFAEYGEQVQRNELLRTREVEKQALRTKIQELRDETGNVVVEYQRQRDAKIAAANESLKIELNNLSIARTAAENKLASDIAGYEKDRDEKIKAEGIKLDVTLKNIELEEKMLRDSYNLRLEQTHKWVAETNAAHKTIQPIVIPVTYQTSGLQRVIEAGAAGQLPGTPAPAPSMLAPSFAADMIAWAAHTELMGFADGGIVTQPTVAMIGEAGPEAIVPLNEMGNNITINFTEPTFFDREDTMNKFVQMIRQGIQRQDRLRFGGAYGG